MYVSDVGRSVWFLRTVWSEILLVTIRLTPTTEALSSWGVSGIPTSIKCFFPLQVYSANQLNVLSYFAFFPLILFRLWSVSLLSWNFHSFVLTQKMAVIEYLFNMRRDFRRCLRLENYNTFIFLLCGICKEMDFLNALYAFAYKELFMSCIAYSSRRDINL